MKKLKLNFDELEKEFQIIDKKEMKSISGGYDCVFNAMGYLSSLYGGYCSSANYQSSYTGTWAPNGDGIDNTQMKNYVSANFSTQSINNGGDLYSFLGSGGGASVLATIHMGGIGHAVIIQSYNPSNGVLYGIDPSNNNSAVTINQSDLYASGMIGICGNK